MASERTTLTGDGAWHQIGSSPATVQLISAGASVMLVCAAATPTGSDGLILVNQGDSHTFQLATTAIWAQVVQTGASATVAVQIE